MRFFHQHKTLLGFIIVLGVMLAGLFLFTDVASEQRSDVEITAPIVSLPDTPVVEAKPNIKLVFLGDTMLDRGVETKVRNFFEGDYSRLFDNLDFSDADIVFVNLEGPVSDKGRNVGSKWSFRMDPVVLPVLKNAGIDIVSFANNHVGDWSQAAFEDTLTRLEENDIAYTGAGWNWADAIQPTVLEVDGVSIGFLGFTDVGPNWMKAKETTPGILLASDTTLESIIKDAAASVDVLVTSFHWGEEYTPHNTHQTELAHAAIDAGADLVIGHHSHVIQDIEWYNDKLIAYGLGNFIFDQYFSNETMQGLMLTVELDETDITAVTRYIVELDDRYQPQEPREFLPTDVVSGRVSTSSLCPQDNGTGEDRMLFNVSQTQSLDDYAPAQLTHMNNRIDARGTATCLVPRVADAVEAMVNAASKDGMRLVMTSGYRSSAVQNILYTDHIADKPASELPAVAKPGHSEHQLGTTVDFKSLSTPELSYDQFGDSPEYRWLIEHAADYGFVQSYTAGSESVTGYVAEPWHWRYVGVDVAREVQASGLTLMEYLALLEV